MPLDDILFMWLMSLFIFALPHWWTYILSTRHSSKCFTNSHSHILITGSTTNLFYRQGIWDTERLSNPLKVTQPLSGGTRIQSQITCHVRVFVLTLGCATCLRCFRFSLSQSFHTSSCAHCHRHTSGLSFWFIPRTGAAGSRRSLASWWLFAVLTRQGKTVSQNKAEALKEFSAVRVTSVFLNFSVFSS